MSTSKPGTTPRWGDVGGDIVVPVSAKKDVGFVASEKPAAPILNWLFNLIYQWLAFFNAFFTTDGGAAGAIDFEGNAKIEGQLRLQDENVGNIMSLVALDQTEHARFMIDWNGLPAGQYSEWVEQWRTSGTTDPAGWTFFNSGAGPGVRSYEITGPTVPFPPMRSVLLSCTAGAADSAGLRALNIAHLSSSLLFTMEWDMRTGTAVDSGDAARIEAGIEYDHSAANDYKVQFFGDHDVNVNWQARITGSGGAVDIDTGVPIVANSTYRCRIEILGDALHAGSNFLARFWMADPNGSNSASLVASTTFSDPAQDMIHPRFSVFSPTTDGPYTLRIGEVRCRWTHRLTSDYGATA